MWKNKFVEHLGSVVYGLYIYRIHNYLMEVTDNIPVPIETRGGEKNPEYYLGNKIYDIPIGSSVWFSDKERYDRSRILSRFHHINYGRKAKGEIKESDYRKFVSKKESKEDEQGFRIWRIK